MDQATNKLQEQLQALKAEAYDLNNTIKNQNQIIMVICQGLEVDLSKGLDMESVMARIAHLRDNQVEMEEETE